MSGHDHDTMPGAMAADQAARITKVTARLSVATALVLIGLKLWAWLVSDSVSMLSSLADSGLDAAASVFTLLAVSYAAMPPDDEYRHGHGKAEGFAAIFQAVLVGVSATLIAIEAIRRFLNPQPIEHTTLAFIVMGISIVLTGLLVTAQTRAVRKTASVATEGDRAHYISDIAANFAVIGGIAATAFTGLLWADPVIGLAIAIWLGWSALGVANGGLKQLLDHELSDEARARIKKLAMDTGAVLDVHMLRTRASGPYIHIQFHADLPPNLSLIEAHERMVIAENAILAEFPAADVLIHPDPRGHAEMHGSEAFKG